MDGVKHEIDGMNYNSDKPILLYCPNFRTMNFKVWTVLSTEENLLLRLHPLLSLLPEMSSFVPSAITRPFFELQTPDFAWKFVWTVPTNYTK